MTLFSLINRAIISNLKHAGICELSSHYIIPDLLNEDSLTVDLGANRGHFYTKLIKAFNCKCIAIEASPTLFSKLPILDGVSTYNYAISKIDGPIKFFISDNTEANSLDLSIADAWGIIDEVTVNGLTFETFKEMLGLNSNIDLFKIDIEGAELDLIEGLSSHTLSQIVQIPVEFHDFLNTHSNHLSRIHQAIKKLKKNNFLIIKISSNDWRETLCINTKLISLSTIQSIRLRVLHPLLQFLKRTHIFLGSVGSNEISRNKK